MIIYKRGDLFSSVAEAFAHGCNTEGRMGAGIAREFKRRYIKMYKEYQKLCAEGKFRGGDVFIFNTSDNRFVFNLATQDSLSGAHSEYIEVSLYKMKEWMKAQKVLSVAMPKIGCGLGGIDWNKDVKPIVDEIFIKDDIIVEIWEK